MTRYILSAAELIHQLQSQLFLQIVPILNAKAVLLRLTAGSQEAGFLTSFCPISKFPTVVVIKYVEL